MDNRYFTAGQFAKIIKPETTYNYSLLGCLHSFRVGKTRLYCKDIKENQVSFRLDAKNGYKFWLECIE